jgi:hypothetical protein
MSQKDPIKVEISFGPNLIPTILIAGIFILSAWVINSVW